MAIIGHSCLHCSMAAFGCKADIMSMGRLCPLMTQSGHQRRFQSEALQPDPTNACGDQHNRKAYHVEKRDPRGGDNKRRKHTELDNDTRLEKRT
jgi:hypothetical protein